MRNMLAVLFAFVTLPGQFAWADTIYKCKNTEGRLLYQETPCAKEGEAVSAWASKSATVSGDNAETSSQNNTLVIGQSRGGHYFVDGAINNQYLNFVIDTGASLVSLPQAVAFAAGMRCEKRVAMHTGNGVAMACTATIRELKIGNFTVRNVNAVIAPNLGQPLLGMNVLKQFRVEQDSGEMRLSKKY